MSFRTEFNTRLQKTRIDLTSKVLTIGSCFSDSMGSRLRDSKMDVLINPFGTVYSPVSIHKLLMLALHDQKPEDESYLEREGMHFNYYFHSSLAELDRAKLVERISDQLELVRSFLCKCDYLLITYGTAWVYERHDNREVVANCHKQPAGLFSKRLLDQEEILRSFHLLADTLKLVNPKCRVILTLSPVRHLKDTLELNTVSKSLLRLICYSITQTGAADYFPAYEIMMDDLRDYRFYGADLIHPSPMAEQYIWEKFSDQYFAPETQAVIHQWEGVKRLLAHRPFHPQSESHQKFLKETLSKLNALRGIMDVTEEISLTEKLLIANRIHGQ